MDNLSNNMLNDANSSYHSSNFRRALNLFSTLSAKYPDSMNIMAGQAICLVRLGRYADAESIIGTIDENRLAIGDDLSRFRIVYSKLRILLNNNLFQDMSNYMVLHMPIVHSKYLPVINIEKAALLIMENNKREALPLLLQSIKELPSDQKTENIGRAIFLLSSINEWRAVLHLSIEEFRNHPNTSTFLRLILLGILGNPFYLTIVVNIWWLSWFIIPISVLSVVIISFCTIVYLFISYLSSKRNLRRILPQISISIMTFGIFFLKKAPSPLQLAVLLGFLIAYILIIILYKSIFQVAEKSKKY